MIPPGLMISAPSSGTGKTTLMLGLLAAFRAQDVEVQAANPAQLLGLDLGQLADTARLLAIDARALEDLADPDR